jgi:hypothetical protein
MNNNFLTGAKKNKKLKIRLTFLPEYFSLHQFSLQKNNKKRDGEEKAKSYTT